MLLIDRYLSVCWLRMFALCQSGFLAIYLIIDFMEKFGRFMRAGASVPLVLKFFLFKIPEIVRDTMPFAVLMATLLTLVVLSRSSELTACRSCGLSVARIARPLLLLGFLVSLVLLLNTEWALPKAARKNDYIDKVLIKKQGGVTSFRLNNIWFRSEHRILQAHQFDPVSQRLKGVVVWEISKGMQPVQRFDAQQAYRTDTGWVLEKGTCRRFDQASDSLRQFEKQEIQLDLAIGDLRTLDKDTDNLSFAELRSYAKSLEKGGYNASRYLTIMHAKLSAPFAAFVMVVLGIPFALKTARSSGVAASIGTGVAIGFGYFVMNAIMRSYGVGGVIPPLVAAWGANIIFILSGIWLAMTVRQQ